MKRRLTFAAQQVQSTNNDKRTHGSVFKYVNVRPKGVKTLKGDCSTRCISYCLGMEYLQVKNEQILWAQSANELWNGAEFWDTMLRRRGWRRIYFKKPVARWKVAEATAGLLHPLATSSYGHVCATFQGKVIDLSQTQLGRVQYVVCHWEDYENARIALKELGLKRQRKSVNSMRG